MALNVKNIKAGQTLWDCKMEREGNTTIRSMGSRRVQVLEVIDYDTHRVFVVSWNGNASERWTQSRVATLKLQPARTKTLRSRFSFGSPGHVYTCATCKTTEGLTRCTSCGSIRCPAHVSDDTCIRVSSTQGSKA